MQEDKKKGTGQSSMGGVFSVLRGGSVLPSILSVPLAGPFNLFCLTHISTKATPAVFFVGRSLLFLVKKVEKGFHVNLIKFSFSGKKTA